MATWVGYPRWYSEGRNRPVQYVVIHATHGSEGPLSAENGHAYNLVRSEKVSTHIFVDSNSAIREVPDGDRAYHARFHGNEVGLGIEICGRADQTAAQWDDPVSRATLAIAAREAAAMCRDHAIPVRRLTVAECRAAYYNPEGQRPKGIVGHIDVTRAYPEDNGTHWDPGPNFPWARFLGMVAEEMGDDDMPTADEIAKAVWDQALAPYNGLPLTMGQALGVVAVRTDWLNNKSGLLAKVESILAEVSADKSTPTTVTEADRTAIAQRVVTEMAAALAG